MITPKYANGHYVYAAAAASVQAVRVKRKTAQRRHADRTDVAVLVHGHQAGARDWRVYVSGGVLIAEPPLHATGNQSVIVEIPRVSALNVQGNM